MPILNGMSFSIITSHPDGAPVTREVMDEETPWETVMAHAKDALVRYPEAANVIVTNRAGTELWRWPEGTNA